MSVGKKVFILLCLLVALIIYTVYTFEYKTILSDSEINNNPFLKDKTEYVNSFIKKLEKVKQKVLSYMDSSKQQVENKVDKEQIVSKPVQIQVQKEEGELSISGLFKNEKQAKKVRKLLNIQNQGDFTYEKGIVLDDALLSKISKLLPLFENYFQDKASLNLSQDKISLLGTLKEESYKKVLDEEIKNLGLDVAMDVKVPVLSKTEKIIESIKEKNLTHIEDIAKNEDIKAIATQKEEVVEKKEETPKVIDEKTIQEELNSLLAQEKITFQRRSTKITKNSMSVVKKIADTLKKNDNIKVEIAGHTDSRGSASLNKRISQQRANSVKNTLVKLGIKKDRLKAVGYGEEFPIAKDDLDGLSEENRRVEFNIIRAGE